MAALLKKTIEKGSDALSMSARKKPKNNVIKYQEFTHEEEEEESKEDFYQQNS